MSRSRKQRAQSPRQEDTKPGVLSPEKYSRLRVVLFALGLVLLTLSVFSELRHADFIRLDDPGYVQTNSHVTGGLTKSALEWAWTTGHAANWHPLTWMSHMLDVELFGMWVGGHHMMSVVLHAVNSLLLFVLLVWTTGAPGRSAFVAGLFAVHPMHVESVAWVAERKDVLSTLFWLLTMLAYVGWTKNKRASLYLLACVLMALGLLSKPMLVTLPFALLLFDVWPLQRWSWSGPAIRRLLIEKVPFVALAVASSAVTFLVQRQGGAMTGLNLLPLTTRVSNAVVAYARYVWKLVWPADLVIFYPYREDLPLIWVAGSVLLLIAASAIAIRMRERRPYITVGWFWFFVTLIPVIGLVQVGTQAIADRYTYVPYVGLFIVLAWGGLELASVLKLPRMAVAALACVPVTACAVLTFNQARVWQTNASVWRHAAAASPNNYLAENELGMVLVVEGKPDDAIPHFEASSRLKPEFAEVRNNLGLSRVRAGRIQDAIEEYRLALRLKPGFPEAQANLAYALMAAGQIDEAAVYYREALRSRPDLANTHTDYGVLLAGKGQIEEAIHEFEQAVRLEPNEARPRFLLGMAYGASNRFDDAAQAFREVLRLKPSDESARTALMRVEAMKRAAAKGK